MLGMPRVVLLHAPVSACATRGVMCGRTLSQRAGARTTTTKKEEPREQRAYVHGPAAPWRARKQRQRVSVALDGNGASAATPLARSFFAHLHCKGEHEPLGGALDLFDRAGHGLSQEEVAVILRDDRGVVKAADQPCALAGLGPERVRAVLGRAARQLLASGRSARGRAEQRRERDWPAHARHCAKRDRPELCRCGRAGHAPCLPPRVAPRRRQRALALAIAPRTRSSARPRMCRSRPAAGAHSHASRARPAPGLPARAFPIGRGPADLPEGTQRKSPKRTSMRFDLRSALPMRFDVRTSLNRVF